MSEADLPDDLTCVARVRLGDREAFAVIVDRHQVRLRNYCRELLSDAGLGDDAAQEVFLRAFQRLHTFRGDSLFITWLYKIARNFCFDQLQVHRRRRLSRDAFEEQGRIELRPCAGSTPETLIEQRQLLLTLLSRLPPRYREVLLLKEWEGLPLEKIAEITGCTIDAVKSRLKRARQSLSVLRNDLEIEKDGQAHLG